MAKGDSKEYEEIEFGVWVERPDPLTAPSCGAQWNGEWKQEQGPRPRCFRAAGHEGEHHETVKTPGRLEWLEYYWTEDPATARVELRRSEPDVGAEDTDTAGDEDEGEAEDGG